MTYRLGLAVLLALAGCSSSPRPRLTVADVTARSQAGTPGVEIIHEIEESRSRFYLTVADILALRAAGVPDSVIDRMLQSAWRPETIESPSRPWYDSPYHPWHR